MSKGTSRVIGTVTGPCCRSAAQAMLQDNPWTGLFFIASVSIASLRLGFFALVGIVTSTVTSVLLERRPADRRAGLYGYNGFLVALAVGTYLGMSWLTLLFAAVGAAISSVVMAGAAAFLGPRHIPVLTAPFVLAAWIVLLGDYGVSTILGHPPALSGKVAGNPVQHVQSLGLHSLSAAGRIVMMVVEGTLRGVGQVLLQRNLLSGALCAAGLALSSPRVMLLGLWGSAVGTMTGSLLGVHAGWVGSGLYGFNAVLTAIAIGSGAISRGRAWLLFAYATFGSVLSVFIAVGATDLLALCRLVLPVLTLPFVLVTWLFSIVNRRLRLLPAP